VHDFFGEKDLLVVDRIVYVCAVDNGQWTCVCLRDKIIYMCVCEMVKKICVFGV
jgi:hypothetical protein